MSQRPYPLADPPRVEVARWGSEMGFRVVAEAPMGNGETWLQPETDRLAASGVKVGKIDDTPWGNFITIY